MIQTLFTILICAQFLVVVLHDWIDISGWTHGRQVYAARIAVMTDKLIADGHPPDRARRLAILAVSALQGALIQSRVERSGTPILVAAEELKAWLDVGHGAPPSS